MHTDRKTPPTSTPVCHHWRESNIIIYNELILYCFRRQNEKRTSIVFYTMHNILGNIKSGIIILRKLLLFTPEPPD